MAASLREFARCIGVTGPFSVLGQFYGFKRGSVPSDPESEVLEVSLREQMAALSGPFFTLNVIAIGGLKDADYEVIDYALYRLRNIYRQGGVGIGSILHWSISKTDANGLDQPTSFGDLKDIDDTWSVPNDGLDLFFPHNMMVFNNGSPVLGYSGEIDGPCDKQSAKKMACVICGLWDKDQTARTLAHELGHYLGLRHNHDSGKCPATTSGNNNLMAQTTCVFAAGLSVRTSVRLKNSQGTEMRNHCSMKTGCQAGGLIVHAPA